MKLVLAALLLALAVALPWTPRHAAAQSQASVVYECVIGAPYYAPPLIYYVTEPALLPDSTLALWASYGIVCSLED